MKQTAVEFLVKEFSDILGTLDIKPMQDLLLVDVIKRAKKMENKQLKEMYLKGIENYDPTFKNTEQ
jgi:hypothetical protein